MKIYYSFEEYYKIKNPVVTTGTFDGVHVGHTVIINRLKDLAAEIDGETVLITFHPHPRKVLYPEKSKDLKLINSQEEKKLMLASTGLDHLFIIEFTLEFSKTSSHTFVNDILLSKLNAKVIVVGFNHHFGHNRAGDYEYLYKLSAEKDFKVEEIEQQVIENEAISSTRIRKAIAEGHIGRVNAYLDHHYIIYGKVSESNKDVFNIEISEQEKLLPPPGRYAAKLEQKDELIYCVVEIFSNENNKPNICISSLYDETPISNNIKSILYFYKKIRLFDNNNENTKESVRNKDIEDIKELIY